MQNCVQDLFDTIFSRYACYDAVYTYESTLISLIINYGDTSAFCMYEMYDTSYDTTIVTSLIVGNGSNTNEANTSFIYVANCG
jgi:hypothetical protein